MTKPTKQIEEQIREIVKETMSDGSFYKPEDTETVKQADTVDYKSAEYLVKDKVKKIMKIITKRSSYWRERGILIGKVRAEKRMVGKIEGMKKPESDLNFLKFKQVAKDMDLYSLQCGALEGYNKALDDIINQFKEE